MEFLKHHKIVIIIAVIVLIFIGWYSMTPSSAPILSDTSLESGIANPADQDLIESLLALRAVKLDSQIFANPAFQALQDFSTAIIPEPVGRPNPFAPLSARTASESTSAATTIFFAPKSH